MTRPRRHGDDPNSTARFIDNGGEPRRMGHRGNRERVEASEIARQRTSAVLVEIFTTSLPGKIAVAVSNAGPTTLGLVEQRNALHAALLMVDNELAQQEGT